MRERQWWLASSGADRLANLALAPIRWPAPRPAPSINYLSRRLSLPQAGPVLEAFSETGRRCGFHATAFFLLRRQSLVDARQCKLQTSQVTHGRAANDGMPAFPTFSIDAHPAGGRLLESRPLEIRKHYKLLHALPRADYSSPVRILPRTRALPSIFRAKAATARGFARHPPSLGI